MNGFNRQNARRGFFTADMMIAFGIVAVLAVSAFVILARASGVASKMSDSRTSARAAETAFADLQADRPVNGPPGVAIDIRAEPGAAAARGYVWVRVSAALAGQSAELVGLVPDGPRLREAEAHASTQPTTREGP